MGGCKHHYRSRGLGSYPASPAAYFQAVLCRVSTLDHFDIYRYLFGAGDRVLYCSVMKSRE